MSQELEVGRETKDYSFETDVESTMMDFGMLSEKQTKDMMRFIVRKASWETWVQLYRNAIIRDQAQGRKTTDLTPVKEEVTLWKTTEKGKSLNFLEIYRLVLSLCVVAEWSRETVLGWSEEECLQSIWQQQQSCCAEGNS